MNPLIIIPAWNEEEVLGDVIADLRAANPDCDLLVIVDGATDDTAAVARRTGAHVVELPFNLGIGGALRTGFVYAVDAGYDRAVQFDADGQHDSTEIPKLLDALASGSDLVIGSRFETRSAKYRRGPVRHAAMSALRILISAVTGRRFTDTSSGFRGFSAPMLRYFARTYPVEFMDSVEALVLALRGGFSVTEVPVAMRDRQGGTASNGGLRLVYHYFRLFVVILATARRMPAVRISKS